MIPNCRTHKGIQGTAMSKGISKPVTILTCVGINSNLSSKYNLDKNTQIMLVMCILSQEIHNLLNSL